MKVQTESEVTQSCPTLSDPMDCSLGAPPSMGFCRQEYWSGVPLPSPAKHARILQFNPLSSGIEWKLQSGSDFIVAKVHRLNSINIY